MKKIVVLFSSLIMSLFMITPALPHCEIPCGIYGDRMRIEMIKEHLTTIEKSMKMIEELSKLKKQNQNQIVRWINNKEKHANNIQEIVSQYFMAQRVKPADEKDVTQHKQYVKKLTILHQILINTMKTKQTTDLSYVEKLRSLTNDFSALYFELASK